MQDALDFRDGLWQVERTVRAGDDEFGVRAVEVRALISDNAIGAIRRIALAAVADDGVVRNLNRSLIERVQERRFRREPMHAGRENETFLTSDNGQRVAELRLDVIHHLCRKMNQAEADRADAVVGQGLPRCGTQMKTTRLTRGLASKMSALLTGLSGGTLA